MKHTDFYQKIREIKASEESELIDAIMAHGGQYTWAEGSERPIIAINLDRTYPCPMDVEVESVVVKNGCLTIFGSEMVCVCADKVEFGLEEVFAGHLSYIIDYIPDTENVCDVTKKQEFFKVTSVSRDDLEFVGFDTENISDEDMVELADKMGDDYVEQLFWSSLEILAEMMGFERKEQE